MTTLEQTLLDTLQKPWHCGGSAVVHEAWERGISLLDEERLSDYLKRIGRIDLVRRVGYMFDQQGRAIGNQALTQILSDAKMRVQGSLEPLIPLLSGLSAQEFNETWGLYV